MEKKKLTKEEKKRLKEGKKQAARRAKEAAKAAKINEKLARKEAKRAAKEAKKRGVKPEEENDEQTITAETTVEEKVAAEEPVAEEPEVDEAETDETEDDEAEDADEKKLAARPKNYHVSLREDGKWQVKSAKSTRALKLFDTQAEAIAFAKEKAENQDGNITIHKKDGKIRKQRYDK